jgi:two-component system sensor histidine kinase KdpD
MADRRHAEWMAVYVETPRHHRLSGADRDRVGQTLRLAEQLGGEAVTIPGHNMAEDLIRYAQSRNVTELIIGKSRRSRWSEIWRSSVVHDVIRKSGDIDVYVISGEDSSAQRPQRPRIPRRPLRQLNAYLGSTLAVVLAGLIAKLIELFLPLPNLSIVFLTAVLFSAVTWGLWPAIFAAILSMLVYDFGFVPPMLTLTVPSPQDLLALSIFLIVAVLTSHLTARVRDQAETAKRREARTAALYALSREIASAAGLPEVLGAIVTQVGHILNAKVVVLLPDADRLVLRAAEPSTITLTEMDRATATWAWQHNQPAGRGADTLPGGEWFYQPLRTAQGTVGVVGLQFETPDSVLSPAQRRLLDALAGQAAVAIERARLVEEREQSLLAGERERLAGR